MKSYARLSQCADVWKSSEKWNNKNLLEILVMEDIKLCGFSMTFCQLLSELSIISAAFTRLPQN